MADEKKTTQPRFENISKIKEILALKSVDALKAEVFALKEKVAEVKKGLNAKIKDFEEKQAIQAVIKEQEPKVKEEQSAPIVKESVKKEEPTLQQPKVEEKALKQEKVKEEPVKKEEKPKAIEEEKKVFVPEQKEERKLPSFIVRKAEKEVPKPAPSVARNNSQDKKPFVRQDRPINTNAKKPNNSPAKSIIKILDKGIFVTGFNGGNCNGATGDFSYGIQGFYFENGEILFPIKEMNISGNILKLWKNIALIGTDARTCSRWMIPSLAFTDVDFTGI